MQSEDEYTLSRKKIWHLIQESIEHSTANIFIVIDNFHLTHMRKQYFKFCQKKRYSFHSFILVAPLEVLLQRNSKRPNSVDHSIITRMYEGFQYSDQFNKPEIASFETKIYDSELNLDKMLSLAKVPPEITVPAVKLPAVQSEAHQADIMLRRTINRLFAENKHADAKLLMQKKKEIIAEISSSSNQPPLSSCELSLKLNEKIDVILGLKVM